MSESEIVAPEAIGIGAPPPREGWRGVLAKCEDLLITLALAVMIVLPLLEVVLRKTAGIGIVGSQDILDHFTLVVGMLGGAIAARDRRLLSLSTLETVLKGNWLLGIRIFSSGMAGAVSVALAIAGWRYVQDMPADKILVYGIRLWVVQLIIPAGFAVIALRVVWHGTETWWSRVLALLIAAGVVAIGIWPPVEETSTLLIPAMILLFLAAVAGSPLFAIIGGSAVFLYWGGDLGPISSVSESHYGLATDPMLPTIPLFTLAGYFLAEGGASRRLIRLFQAIVGPLRGGPAIVTVLVCAFFTSFTGASGVTILALGGLLMPVLLAAGYKPRPALGLVTSAGSLGLLFPPCLPLILYGIIAKTPVEQMFLAGIVPGILLVVLTAIWGILVAPRNSATRPKYDRAEILRAIWGAKFEIAMPAVAMAFLFGGFATPVEAAAVTALYAFISETIVHRDLKLFSDIPRVMTECGLLIGGVLVILGAAKGLTTYLIDARVPDQAVEWVTGSIHSPLVFLLLLNLFLLIVGCLMDVYSAIIVVVPIIVPIANKFGINPLHLGIIFLANLEIGFLTPPVGMNLFLASYRFKKPMAEVTRSILPMLGVLIFGVLVITYIPPLTTWLPSLFSHSQSATAAPVSP